MSWISGRIAMGAVVVACAPWAAGEVVITEIMYNPTGDERASKTEWVEIYNAGEEAADVAGWYLADEDGQTAALPAGVTIEPKQAVVLIPGERTAEEFRAAWGSDLQAYPLAGWAEGGMNNLANKPGNGNEVLTLRSSDGAVIDQVAYDDDGGWPKESAGSSIYLLPELINATANDDGSRWRNSEPGSHGAKNATATEFFSEKDAGSPGFVQAP